MTPLRLPTVEAVTCPLCGRRVHFRVVSTQSGADPAHYIQYLRCPTPNCPQTATRLREITPAPPRHAIINGLIIK